MIAASLVGAVLGSLAVGCLIVVGRAIRALFTDGR